MSIGPVRGKKLAAELADHLTSLYRLRHCGRRMRRREHPSIYGQMGRCCSPCLGDLDPNAYRGQVDKVLALFEHEHGAAEPLLAEIDDRMARGRRASAATSAPPRCCAGASAWRRCWAASTACCAPCTPTRGWCWPATRCSPASTRSGWSTAGWPTGARCPSSPARWRAAAARCWKPAGRAERTSVPAEDVDEVRIASAWMAEHRPPELSLAEAVEPARVERFVAAAAA